MLLSAGRGTTPCPLRVCCLRGLAFGFLLLGVQASTQAVAQNVLTVTPEHCVYRISVRPEIDPGWAQPGFDDSGWVSCLPSPDSYLPPGPYQWTRCRLDLKPLARTGPPFVQIEEFSAWQLFVDGQQIGSFGNLEKGSYWMDLVQRFPVPRKIADRGTVLVALRETRRALPTVRYSAVIPPISAGPELVLAEQTRLASVEGLSSRRVQFLCYGFITAGGVFLIILTGVERGRKDILWLSIIYLATGELRANELAQVFLVHYPHWLALVLFWAGQWLYLPVAAFAFALTGRKLPKAYVVLGLISPILQIGNCLSFVAAPRMDQLLGWYAYYNPISRGFSGLAGLAAMSCLIAAFWPVWKIRPGLRPLFWVCVLWASGECANIAASRLPWFLSIDPTGLVREYRALVSVPVALAMFFLLSRRQRKITEERSELQAEMRAAQEMQRLLVPETLDLQPWIVVDVAYLPAKEVGGDFYFCRRVDGAQLIVVGDVSGKGLRAAMLVAMITGTLRNVTEQIHNPAAVLNAVNRTLSGQMQGSFATCVAVWIGADGLVSIANAGHLAPVLNGADYEIAGSLPLGLVADAGYEEQNLELEPSDSLTLYTDGVPEAQNPEGELFGFARTTELIGGASGVSAIAQEAQKFGQTDDITVLRIQLQAREVHYAIA
jgi:hypothetical protein